MKFVGYIRVSTVRGRSGPSFISADSQRDAIEAWAKGRREKGATVEIVEYLEELNVSGKKLRRPRLNRALAMIAAGEVDGIAVARIDRFSRAGVGDALTLIHHIEEELKGHVVAVDSGLDPTSKEGSFVRTVFLALAKLQLDQITSGWKEAQKRAVERGVHIASTSPTGYEKGPDKLLVPAASAPAIAELFRKRAAGVSWRDLSKFLKAEGVVSPYKGEQWTTRAIQGIVANRVYLGEARGGKNVNKNAHPPIIDRATWEAAQGKRATTTPRRDSEGALLAGLIRCGGCRYVMKPDSQKLRNGERVRLYRCRGEHAQGTCTQRAAVLGSVIEPFVIASFLELYDDVEAEAISSLEVREAENQLVAAELKLEEYLANTDLIGIVGVDKFNKGAQVRKEEIDDAIKHLRSLRPLGAQHVDMRSAWEEASVSGKRQLLENAIDAVIVMSGRGVPIEQRTYLLEYGAMPDDFPRRGLRVPLAPYDP